MYVPNWLGSPFNMKVDNKGYESYFENKRIDVHVTLTWKPRCC